MNNQPIKSFRVNLYGIDDSDASRTASPVDDQPGRLLANAPFGGSFEDLITVLDSEPRIHAELDGSFVFRSDLENIQIDGMIYDFNGEIQYIELIGNCDLSTWQWLICLLHCERSVAYRLQDLSSGQVLSSTDFELILSDS